MSVLVIAFWVGVEWKEHRIPMPLAACHAILQDRIKSGAVESKVNLYWCDKPNRSEGEKNG